MLVDYEIERVGERRSCRERCDEKYGIFVRECGGFKASFRKNDLLTVEIYRKLCKEKVDAAINETNRECTLR